MNYVLIKTKNEFINAVEECRQDGIFSFDYETAPLSMFRTPPRKEVLDVAVTLKKPALSPHYSRVVTISFCSTEDTVYVLGLHHIKGDNIEFPESEMWEILRTEIFENNDVCKIAYNLPFECQFTARYGILLSDNVFDPMHGMIRWYQATDPDKLSYPLYKGMGLKEQTLDLFNHKMEQFAEVTEEVDHFDETDINVSKKYAGEDSIYSLKIWKYVKERLESIEIEDTVNGIYYGERPYKNYYDVVKYTDCSVMRSIGLMQYYGINYGKGYEEALEKAEELINNGLRELETFAHERGVKVTVGKNGKTKSVNEFIFDTLQCPQFVKTEKGKPSLSSEALKLTIATIEANAPSPEYLQDSAFVETCIRQLEDGTVVRYPNAKELLTVLKLLAKVQKTATIKSSHLVGRKKYVNVYDGKIHASYDILTNTSRFSSSSPNNQNIPRDKGDFSVRDIYQPEEGHILLCVDYQGQEARIGAELYQDDNMIGSILEGIDMHSFVANRVFNLGFTQGDLVNGARADKEYRNPAKISLFQKMYCGSAFSLRTMLRTMDDYKTIDECQTIMDGLSASFPNMIKYQNHVANFAFDKGYVETMLGYRRYLPEIRSSDDREVKGAMRRAGNTPVQGTAGDVTKKGMNNFYNLLLTKKWSLSEVKLVATIHDEVVYEVKKMPMDRLRELVEDIRQCMEEPIMEGLRLNQVAEPEVADAHDIYGIGKSNGWGSKMDFYRWADEVELAQLNK